uniref:Uncharacterized protein n=1 Tax=Panagrolaimus sp. PS1159 TaxID=55785 RepID=A0AC35EXV3_9BILA
MVSWDSTMSRDQIDLCNVVLETLRNQNLINDDTVLQVADYYSFNQQTDRNSCGWHICIISEDIARYATAIVSQQPRQQPVRRSTRIQQQHKEERPEITASKIDSLKKRGIPIAKDSSEIFPKEHYLGPMDKRCKFCRAYLFRDETSNKCCANGTVPAPIIPPEPLQYTALARHAAFWNNIRPLNALFRMVSVSVNSNMNDGVYKLQGEPRYNIGDLVPKPGQPHQFVQIYSIDADEAVAARLQDAKRYKIQANETDLTEIIKLIEQMIRKFIPLAQELATMKDKLKQYEDQCKETGETPRKLFIVWEDPQKAGSGGTHPG